MRRLFGTEGIRGTADIHPDTYRKGQSIVMPYAGEFACRRDMFK